jgi:anthranilate/para-aminobenzoate synthase component I
MQIQDIDISNQDLAISSIVNHHKELPPVSLLESTLYNKAIGRYSMAGAFPFMTMEGLPDGCRLTYYNAGGELDKKREVKGDPFLLLQRQYSRYAVVSDAGSPLRGGAIGFFSYELLSFNDCIGPLALPPRNGIEVPLYWFAFYDIVCVEDKFSGKLSLLATDLGCSGKNGTAYIEKKTDLFKRYLSPADLRGDLPKTLPALPDVPVSEMSKDDYRSSIQTILSHIKNGDIFQACFTFSKTVPFLGKSQDLYLLLRETNPSPFSAFIATGGLEIVCCSPERFLRISPDGLLETRPIKGTRGRGRTPDEDRALKKELFESVKDRAENIMITDLLRNDLGRVCSLGSVKVKKLCRIEKYANVFQLVSIIEGRGKYPGKSGSIAYLKSLFPGGSMTGAPKTRAIEILGGLEPEKRGIYSGAIGYLGFNNSIDFNIVIRTAVIKNGKAIIGTGGGIVADSDPESEYNEAQIKVKNIIAAIAYLNHHVRQGLV